MTKAVPGYRAAHYRIEKVRGKASAYECHCGCGEQAKEWALIPGTMHVFWEPKPETGTIRPYSLDPFAYIPMTIAHHRIMDGNSPPMKVPA